MSALGLTAGPQLHDQLRDLVCRGKLSYDNLTIALILEIR
jgi:hypothetical protein